MSAPHLDVDGLRRLARSIAGDPARWRHLVDHDPDRRTYALVCDGDAATVWLLCWSPGHDTGFHDHDGSAGAVAVAEGQVREDRLTLGGEPRGRVVGAGEGFDFGPADIHRVRHAGAAPAVTIHAYSPPLRAMGAYVEDPDTGVVRRELLGEDEELKATGAGVA
ncbi:MAG TPA: cysteine dioxygenase family protein [Solirubrobacteraceae bacterium]|jgi:predicted metal-dependent enzyme (double-stranded beta helix superfamily)|nr:cysteine dioxygenase family protein [Solirubrobacteraceae bacterium]